MVEIRDGYGLVLEENQIKLNQTVFKIYNNRTKLNCLSLKLNRIVKVVWFYGFKPNHN
jgi:hypothetical protein